MKPLPRSFYRRDPRLVAPDLLNKVLVRGERRARIVEVEAYCGSLDPASHAFRGLTARNRSMFLDGGHLYVYFTYGMHWCANAVCGRPGDGGAVLLRAAAPLTGLDEMRRARRREMADRNLCSGPAKLCQAFGITGADDGLDLASRGSDVTIASDSTPPPLEPGLGRRVGVSSGTEHPWRWWVPGDVNVSRGPVGGPISRAGSPRR